MDKNRCGSSDDAAAAVEVVDGGDGDAGNAATDADADADAEDSIGKKDGIVRSSPCEGGA